MQLDYYNCDSSCVWQNWGGNNFDSDNMCNWDSNPLANDEYEAIHAGSC